MKVIKIVTATILIVLSIFILILTYQTADESDIAEFNAPGNNTTMISYFIPLDQVRIYVTNNFEEIIIDYNESAVSLHVNNAIDQQRLQSFDTIETEENRQLLIESLTCKYIQIDFETPLGNNVEDKLQKVECTDQLPDSNLESIEL